MVIVILVSKTDEIRLRHHNKNKFETIFHFVLTLLSNAKKCGKVFQILWPSLNA